MNGAYAPLLTASPAFADTATLVAGTDFLQGINDYQPGIRMVVKKAGNLFLQALPNARTFGLKDQPLRGILAARKPEQAVLQAVEGILQRQMGFCRHDHAAFSEMACFSGGV